MKCSRLVSLVILLFLFTPGCAQQPEAAGPGVGCGTDSNGKLFDQSTCGNTGEAQIEAGKPLYACNTDLKANTQYHLTVDLTATPNPDGSDGVCLDFKNGTVIHGNGHTIKGRVVRKGPADGAEIHNLNVTCDSPYSWGPDGQAIARDCLSWSDSDGGCNRSGTTKFHHLTVSNSASSQNFSTSLGTEVAEPGIVEVTAASMANVNAGDWVDVRANIKPGTTLGKAITRRGSQEVTPSSMAGIVPQLKLHIDSEIVTVTATTPTTFTAKFALSHGAAAIIKPGDHETVKVSAVTATSFTARFTNVHAVDAIVSGNQNAGTVTVTLSRARDCGAATQAELSNITATSAPIRQSSRVRVFFLESNTNGRIAAHHNDVTCGANSAACQGHEVWNADDFKLSSSRVTMQPLDAAFTDNGRGIIIDGGSYCDRCEVTQNLFVANNQRAMRARRARDFKFTKNYIRNVYFAKGRPGEWIHLADPDVGDVDMGAYDVSGNTIEFGEGGGGHGLRAYGTGSISHNTALCASAGCAGAYFFIASTPSGNGTRSEFTLTNNDVSAIPGNKNGLHVLVNLKAAVQTCNTGRVGGTGTNTVLDPCP